MTVVERIIRLVLENVPSIMFAAALFVATFLSGIPGIAERYLAWLLFLSVGVQGIWGGVRHVAFPDAGARYVGWKPSPFQMELGFADIALGVIALLSFWQGLEFKAAVVICMSTFYAGRILVHVRDRCLRGNAAKGSFGALLAMTTLKAAGFPVLLWLAEQARTRAGTCRQAVFYNVSSR